MLSGKNIIFFNCSGNPQQRSIRNLQEPVALLALLRSPHTNAGLKQYECGHTQPLLRMGYDRGKTSGRNLKTNIYKNHETLYTIITTAKQS